MDAVDIIAACKHLAKKFEQFLIFQGQEQRKKTKKQEFHVICQSTVKRSCGQVFSLGTKTGYGVKGFRIALAAFSIIAGLVPTLATS